MNQSVDISLAAFEYAAPEVIAEEFQEGLIVLNMRTGMYFDVGGRLVPLLAYLTEGAASEKVLDAIKAINVEAGADAETAIQSMKAEGLLRPCDCTADAIDPERINDILSSGDHFHFSANDDLAELIIADPIHDIDPETGKLIK